MCPGLVIAIGMRNPFVGDVGLLSSVPYSLLLSLFFLRVVPRRLLWLSRCGPTLLEVVVRYKASLIVGLRFFFCAFFFLVSTVDTQSPDRRDNDMTFQINADG